LYARLLQAALGGGKRDKAAPPSDYQHPSNTPEVVHTALAIIEGYVTHAVPEGRIVMLGDSALDWLQGVVWGCKPPDTDVTQRFIRMASQSRKAEFIDELSEQLMSPSDHPKGVDASKEDMRDFLQQVESKRRRVVRLMQIAHVQAEEQWDSNIKWILRGFRRDASESIEDLERWQERRNDRNARNLQQGIASALLRLGGGYEDVEPDSLLILRRIYDAVLQVITLRS